MMNLNSKVYDGIDASYAFLDES